MDYLYLNQILSEYPAPANVKIKNNYAYDFFRRILFEKALSIFDFPGMPDTWDINYFKSVLFGRGYVAVINVPGFGFIPQECTWSTYNIYYQPRDIKVYNPYLPASSQRDYRLGKDAALLRLRPTLQGIMPIVTYYAAKLAMITQSLDVNIINSKTPHVFEVSNGKQARTIKKAVDAVNDGDPLVITDKDVLKGSGKSIIQDSFTGKNYISDKLADLLAKLENEFNSRIGIPGVDVEKKERLISSEVAASTADNSALANVMMDSLTRDLVAVNSFAGTGIAVKYNYEQQAAAPDQEDELDD